MRFQFLRQWRWSVLLLALLVVSLATVPAVVASSFAPASGRLLLIGQSNKGGWDNFTSIGNEPAGGSVYYEVRSNNFVGGDTGIQRQYADFLAGKSKYIQVGVSWKDNPPGYDGTGDKAAASRQATLDIGNGVYDNLFDTLISYINAHPGAKFLLRIDYEVSSNFHCTDSSCSSYKNAFNHVAQLIRSRNTASNAAFIYHPVRGEFQQLYPGDANVDWIGVSIFNHELCMPIYNVDHYDYNGTPGVGFDTTNNLCKGYILTRDSNGNQNATPYDFQYDFNVLGMMKFAQDHAKPMIFSENAPMNFGPGQNPDGTEPDATVATWVNRVFGLVNYRGPLPNAEGTYDLSGVVKAVVYMNLDLRYGWDGYYGQSGYQFAYDADWYNNAQLTNYNQARSAFCSGLANSGFQTTCGGTNPAPTPTPTPVTNPTPTPTPVSSGNRNAYSQIEAESFDSQSGIQIVNSSTASGGARVGYTNNGDWVSFNGVNFGSSSPQQVTFRYSSGRSTSQSFVLEFHLDSPTGPLLAAPGLLGTGNWDSYNQITFNVSNPPTGTHTVVAVFTANDADAICDLDWFRFS